jgi:hypothetical protein
MGIEDLLRDKRDEILRIAARHGASNVRVFGSVARGDASGAFSIMPRWWWIWKISWAGGSRSPPSAASSPGFATAFFGKP